MRAKQSLFLLLCLAACAAVIAAAFQVGSRRAHADAMEQGSRQLQLMAPDLQALLERFETLPFVLGQQHEVAATLAHADDAAVVARMNASLQAIQRQARVGALYLMDRQGLTIAASNWDRPLGFVGKNFSYRPYFSEALAGRAGRFYGIGTNTGEAGYFIAQPVYRNGRAGGPVDGVIVVKTTLDEFENTWASSDDPIVLADRSGVIFRTNRPAWRYHSLQPLAAATRAELARTQQYMGQEIAPLAEPTGPHVARAVGRLGWQLMLFPGRERALRGGIQWVAGCALLLACAGVSGWALHQRRRRLQERTESRAALQRAARDLERRIEERTVQLSDTNRHLAQKYAKLQEAERLLRNTRDEFVQAGKLAMLGQMAAGMTHELNQPLAAIRAFADNARTFLARGMPEQADRNLGHISDASARMGAIIAQLKSFARKDEAIASVDLARSVQASAFLLESDFKRRNAALEIDTGSAPLHVTGNAVRIEQVLINLLRNALDAVDGAVEKRVWVTMALEDGAAVVRIRDTGPGISEEVAAHLFEPFFTTKPSGQGLGLGLAISSSIVQAMNGRLGAHNHADGGAQFELRLPLHALPTPEPEETTP